MSNGKPPCIHGNLCRAIWNKKGYIYSVKCPYGCEFYKPIEKKGSKIERRRV